MEAGIVAIVLLALSFSLSCYHLTMGIMWFVTALIGVAAVILISQLINENRILQYFGRISLIILCIHGPVYQIVVKLSILLNLGTDAVRENFLLAMVVVVITMAICSTAYRECSFFRDCCCSRRASRSVPRMLSTLAHTVWSSLW